MEHCNTKNEEGCCSNLDSKDEKIKNLKGGDFKMQIKKKTLLWIVIGILFVSVLYLTFKVNSINTNTIQTAATSAASASSTMVGGC